MNIEVFLEGKHYKLENFSQEERLNLLDSRVIRKLKDNSYIFEIVGLVSLNKRNFYIVPKFCDKINEDTGKFFVKVIKRYLYNNKDRKVFSENLNNVFSVIQTFEYLNDFFKKYGPYKQRYKIYKNIDNKKINWSKTISNNMLVYNNLNEIIDKNYSIFYTDHVSNSFVDYDNHLSYLFDQIFTLLATFLSPILRFPFHPYISNSSLNVLLSKVNIIFQKSSFYKNILKKVILLENGDRKRVLKVLYNFLNNDDSSLFILKDKVFVFGTDNFEMIWEDACIYVSGAKRNHDDMSQPFVKNKISEKMNIFVTNQRLDGFLENYNDSDEVGITIIDAKYYFEKDKEGIRFSSTDIMKQYGYSHSFKWKFNNIKNIFLIPNNETESKTFKFECEIFLGNDEKRNNEIESIKVFSVNPNYIFDKYIKREKCENLEIILKDLLIFDCIVNRQKILFANINNQQYFFIEKNNKIISLNDINLSKLGHKNFLNGAKISDRNLFNDNISEEINKNINKEFHSKYKKNKNNEVISQDKNFFIKKNTESEKKFFIRKNTEYEKNFFTTNDIKLFESEWKNIERYVLLNYTNDLLEKNKILIIKEFSDLDFEKLNIYKTPRGDYICNNNLDLHNSLIKELPDNFTVNGSFNISGCKNLKKIPEYLVVNGNLDLRNTNLKITSKHNILGDIYI